MLRIVVLFTLLVVFVLVQSSSTHFKFPDSVREKRSPQHYCPPGYYPPPPRPPRFWPPPPPYYPPPPPFWRHRHHEHYGEPEVYSESRAQIISEQGPQPETSAATPACDTCSGSNKATSNANTQSGDAVAIAIARAKSRK